MTHDIEQFEWRNRLVCMSRLRPLVAKKGLLPGIIENILGWPYENTVRGLALPDQVERLVRELGVDRAEFLCPHRLPSECEAS